MVIVRGDQRLYKLLHADSSRRARSRYGPFVMIFSLSCVSGTNLTSSGSVSKDVTSQATTSEKESAVRLKTGAADDSKDISIMATLDPLARAVWGKALRARLRLRNIQQQPMVLLFNLPGTVWLRDAGELVGTSHPYRAGETVCIDDAKDWVKLEAGQELIREVFLQYVIEDEAANVVGVTLRIPVLLTDERCSELRFVHQRLQRFVVVYSRDSAEKPPRPVPMPIVEDTELRWLIHEIYQPGCAAAPRKDVVDDGEVYGTGSLADILRWYRAVQDLSKTRILSEIARERSHALLLWEQTHSSAMLTDRKAAKRVRDDLTSALSGR